MTFLCLPRFRTLRCSVRSISSLWFHFRFTEKNTEKGKYVKRNYHTFEKNLGDQKNPKKIIPKLYDTLPTLCTVNGQKTPGASILITRTTSTKLICFRQKFQESLKTAEHPLHQSIRLGLLGIHIALSDHNLISMSKSSRLRVIVWQSLFYPYFEINIEQDKIRRQSLVNQARNWKNWMIMLLFC